MQEQIIQDKFQPQMRFWIQERVNTSKVILVLSMFLSNTMLFFVQINQKAIKHTTKVFKELKLALLMRHPLLLDMHFKFVIVHGMKNKMSFWVLSALDKLMSKS
jgi:hypothetical protein